MLISGSVSFFDTYPAFNTTNSFCIVQKMWKVNEVHLTSMSKVTKLDPRYNAVIGRRALYCVITRTAFY